MAKPAGRVQASSHIPDGVYVYDGERFTWVPECPKWAAKDGTCLCRYCVDRAWGMAQSQARHNHG